MDNHRSYPLLQARAGQYVDIVRFIELETIELISISQTITSLLCNTMRFASLLHHTRDAAQPHSLTSSPATLR